MDKDFDRIGKYRIVKKLHSEKFGYIYESLHQSESGFQPFFLKLVEPSDTKTLDCFWRLRKMDVVIDDCLYKIVVQDHFPFEDYVCIPMEAEIQEIRIMDPESGKDRMFRRTRYLGEVAAGSMFKVERIPMAHEDPRIWGSGIYALCVLNPRIQPEYRALDRLRQQAEIQHGLEHPYIQKVHHCCEGKDGNWYVYMDFKMGQTLAQRAGQIGVDEAVDILCKMASALRCVHEHKIVHRDVKPSNILYPKKGAPCLANFFFAKRLDLARNLINTSPGVSIGTLEFSSPEQAQGMPADTRSDMYSLAVTIYVALANAFPFRGRSKKDIIRAIVNEPLPKMVALRKFQKHPQLPLLGKLDVLLERMTRKNPAHRYEDLQEVESLANLLLREKKKASSPERRPRMTEQVVMQVSPRIAEQSSARSGKSRISILAWAAAAAAAGVAAALAFLAAKHFAAIEAFARRCFGAE